MAIQYSVIGKHIRAARQEARMTQEAVAEAIEMSPAHYGKVERGDRPINLKRLAQLCQLFSMPLEELVAGAVLVERGETTEEAGEYREGDFLSEVRAISRGCSEEALRLMSRLCLEVARSDRQRRLP